MSVVEPGSAGPRLAGRVWAMLSRPAPTWDAIEAEPATLKGLYRDWIAPLAAIPAVCGAIGLLVFGIGIFGVGLRPHLVPAIAEMLVGYAVALAEVYILAVAIDLLAPTFGGVRNQMQAFKLVAYSGAAAWVAGVLALYPSVGWLAGMLGGLYSLYLLYLGLPKLMKAPQEQVLTYFAVVLLLAVTVALVLGGVTERIRDLGGPMTMAAAGVQTSPA